MAEQNNTVKVFVVTGSASRRHKLLNAIDAIPIAELVGQADDPHSAQCALCGLPVAPDVILLDADPRGTDGSAQINRLIRHHPRCKTVVLPNPIDAEGIRRLLEQRLERAPEKKCADTAIDSRRPAQTGRMEKSLANGDAADAGCPAAHPDGTVRYLYDYVDYLAAGQQEKSLSGIVSGINERRRQRVGRRQSEIELMKSVDRFQSLVEQLPGMPYIANLDQCGSNVYVSSRIEELLGFTAEQWCKDPQLRIRQLHPEDRERVLKAINHAIDTKSSFSIDYRIRKRDGSIRWFHDEARVVTGPQGEPLFLQGAVLDVTERKQAQAELERSHHELQELIAALDSLRMQEQKRLAHEMHDDFGQLLAAMKMDLSTLQQHLPQSDSRIVRQLSSINQLVDAMVASMRRIVADLPPKVLEDVGLCSALEIMVANFEKRHRITCRLRLFETEPKLETKVATAIYRVLQETLNNVAKHADANCVEAHINCSETHIRLCVQDNGCGISPDKLRKPGSFGLVGMRERVSALGGEMKIDSKEGAGTAIKITIPLQARTPS